MDSPGASGWPSDLDEHVGQLQTERVTDQTSLDVDTAAIPEVYNVSNIASSTSLSEAQQQQLSQGFFNFSFFPANHGGPSDSVIQQDHQDIIAEAIPQHQSADIQTFTDALQQQLQGLSKDIGGWGASNQQKGNILSTVGTPSTVILSIDGTQQEIPISFTIDPSAALSAVQEEHEIAAETCELDGTYQHFDEVPVSYIKAEDQTSTGEQYTSEMQVASALNSESPVKVLTLTLENQPHSSIQPPHSTNTVLLNEIEQTTEVAVSNEEMCQNIEEEFLAVQRPTPVKLSEKSLINSQPKIQTSAKPTTDNKQNSAASEDILRFENVRKSSRLQAQERVAKNKISDVAVFDPETEYNTQELWCEDCQCCYDVECPHHKLVPQADKAILSRAWASLPSQLQIFRLSDTSDPPELGVFSKKVISKRTQFGPFVAEMTEEKEEQEPSNYPLSVEVEDKVMHLIATDENKCNWMMFVRPAKYQEEQNMVAYQYSDAIYFVTTKFIQPKEELKVWYAAHYAHRWNYKPLERNISEIGEEGKFECYLCEKKLRSMAQLQQHLSEIHDEAGTENNKEEASAASGEEGEDKIKGRNNSSFQSWKKRKRNLYFNKIKKYKEMRQRSSMRREGLKKLAVSYYCSHCSLVFDSASVLNIHTLMHAADTCDSLPPQQQQQQEEDNDPLRQLSAAAAQIQSDSEKTKPVITNGLDAESLQCPCCFQTFESRERLINHTLVHARSRKLRQNRRNRLYNPQKPFQCPDCIKAFATEDRLNRHRPVHSKDDSFKPLECTECHKRFMTPPALACHMKTHSNEKYYTCPICREGFDQMHVLKEHGLSHATNGRYPCPDCHKIFYDFNSIRKHMRMYHPYKELPCPICQKVFPRIDKLKLHMLKHTDHREYMCDQCGRQFKRKDKLREHVKRMHDPHNPKVKRQYNPNSQPKERFVPKVPPADYHRFIYKCPTCLLGFKRRGMLVNHLAKRHPGTRPDSIPELNMPILKTQRDFFCHYCDKVYKSSSKRKAHVLKAHPGAEPPPGGRITEEPIQNVYGINCATFSQLSGSVATAPNDCQFCHKQYASKPKLLQHQRKAHPDMVPPKRTVMSEPKQVLEINHNPELDEKIVELHDMGSTIIVQPEGQVADILTQAMSELTQSFTTEYRPAVQHQEPASPDPHRSKANNGTTEYQISLTGLGANDSGPSQTTGIILQPTLVQTPIGGTQATAAVDLSQILQEITAQEESGLTPGLTSQPIRIISGNQSQTLTVPISFATQLLSRSVVQNVAK